MKQNEFEKIKNEAQEEMENEWQGTRFDELVKKEIPEIRFRVSGLVPSEAITCLSGNAGLGKSWLTIELALAVSEGRKFLNTFDTNQTNVLIVDEERGERETQRRLKLLGNAEKNKTFIYNLQGIRIDNLDHLQRLLDICEEKEIGLVIFDSLRAINSLDENTSKDGQDILNCLKMFIRKQVTVVVTHHNRKIGILTPKDPESRLRGSSGLLAGFTSLISLDKSENMGKRLEMEISHPKFNEGEKTQAFQVALQETEGKMAWEFMNWLEEEYSKEQQIKEAITMLLESEGEKFHSQITSTLETQGFKNSTIRKVITDMKVKKEIVERPEGQKKFLHLLNNDSANLAQSISTIL